MLAVTFFFSPITIQEQYAKEEMSLSIGERDVKRVCPDLRLVDVANARWM